MPDLAASRMAAAVASRGASSDPILTSVVQKIVELRLGGDVLDFGAGRGDLLSRLTKLGSFSALAGTDLLPRPQELPAALSWNRQDLNERLRFSDESFDLVTAVEVIEHLENPRALARDWYRVLRPGGRLIVTTPNNESLRALLHLVARGHFVGFADTCYPAHITALVRKDLERILGEAGFEPPEISYVPHGGVPRFPSISWQRVSAGLLRGRRWSDNIVAVARRPS